MNFSTLLCDLLALSAVVSGVLVITSRSPVVSIVYLIALFVIAACYLMMVGVVFVGLSYLVVYVGAVAVLFLFVVMILNVRASEIVSVGLEYTKSLPLGLLLGTLFLFEMLSVLPAAADQLGELLLGAFTKSNTAILTLDVPSSGGSYSHMVYSGLSLDNGLGNLGQLQALAQSLYMYNAL